MSLPPPGPQSVAVVTGGSSGIGVEIARDLHRRGHRVLLVARSAAALDALAGELNRGRPDSAYAHAVDLTDREARAGLLAHASEIGTPDILINNAGFSTLGPAHRADPDAEARLVELDVAAVVDLCTRFLPGMVERRRGAVLNVASTAAYQPLPGQAAYGAAKAFVLSYTSSVHAELRGTGVGVTALCPGPVDTGFGEAAGFAKEDADAALPSFMWIPAADVARAAVDGMAAGRRVVIPGAANKVGAAIAQLAPRRLLLPILARQHPGLR